MHDDVPVIDIQYASLRGVREKLKLNAGYYRLIDIGPDHDRPYAGMTIAEIWQGEDVLTEDDLDALLRLFVAAPDLLSAAELALSARNPTQTQAAESALFNAVRKTRPPNDGQFKNRALDAVEAT